MAILSEAVVTEGEALGMSVQNGCLEGSTLLPCYISADGEVLSYRQLPLRL